ncbi:MAG TPA: FHA domain-containing protein [Blastocatellia bacterium]|jgi:hypothetical protein|nr:FHA domain-containing protein [Blastocatellia bacterium]
MEDKPDRDDRKNVIVITRAELSSSHVDDLLKRQMSLRGEAGITRDRGRRWYYQNWLVFMMAGLLAAVGGWAILEPYLDDMPYVQGPIEKLDLNDHLPDKIKLNDQEFELDVGGGGVLYIRGQKIWLHDRTRMMDAAGDWVRLDTSAVQVGQQIGVYVEYERAGNDNLALAWYVVPSPREPAPAKALLTIRQLAARTSAAGMLFFSLVGGMIGLAVGAADGIVCRLPRRALLAGAIGLVVGFVGGFISSILANLIYAPLTKLAMAQSGGAEAMTTFGFFLQLLGRSMAWSIGGMTAGLGQGIALRSKRLLVYGLLGGVIGGLVGGLLFDPIYFLLAGSESPSAHWSRLVSLGVIGAAVGAMIGVVELLARDAWLRMTAGPLAGKEFLIFKDVMNIGASPRSDIYLFNDPEVTDQHATLRSVGDEAEIESRDNLRQVLVNGRPLQRSRLRHGDQITIGRTVFLFQKRQG